MSETVVVPVQPKRKNWTKLSPADWLQIKASYETDPSRPSCEVLAARYGIDQSTIAGHAKRESWSRQDALALATIKRVEEVNEQIVQQTADKVSAQLSQHLADSLQPWIERQKTQHIRAQVKRSKIALKQLDNHIKPDLTLNPKDSSFVAKTADTWDNIMRRSLGMNDSQSLPGSLTLNVLTNHAAVQIKSDS